jgi:hypothetical protein
MGEVEVWRWRWQRNLKSELFGHDEGGNPAGADSPEGLPPLVHSVLLNRIRGHHRICDHSWRVQHDRSQWMRNAPFTCTTRRSDCENGRTRTILVIGTACGANKGRLHPDCEFCEFRVAISQIASSLAAKPRPCCPLEGALGLRRCMNMHVYVAEKRFVSSFTTG